jgi:hypothetical protein
MPYERNENALELSLIRPVNTLLVFTGRRRGMGIPASD